MLKNAIIFTLSVLIAFALGFLGGRTGRRVVEHVSPGVKADTVIRKDTVTHMTPMPILTTIIDTVLVAYPDTVTIHDTVYIQLPIERKEYAGEEYRAVVSGYRPSLDLIEVFPETKMVTGTVYTPTKKSRWAIGIQAGYGVTIRDGTVAMSPYIGLGISYNINR